MNRNVEVTWITLRTITHSLMVHAKFLDAYIHFPFMYMKDHIFPILSTKYLVNEDGYLTTPFKLATGTNTSVSHLGVLFCPCVVRKDTAHVGTKKLNMCHQEQEGFLGIFVGIP